MKCFGFARDVFWFLHVVCFGGFVCRVSRKEAIVSEIMWTQLSKTVRVTERLLVRIPELTKVEKCALLPLSKEVNP